MSSHSRKSVQPSLRALEMAYLVRARVRVRARARARVRVRVRVSRWRTWLGIGLGLGLGLGSRDGVLCVELLLLLRDARRDEVAVDAARLDGGEELDEEEAAAQALVVQVA